MNNWLKVIQQVIGKPKIPAQIHPSEFMSYCFLTHHPPLQNLHEKALATLWGGYPQTVGQGLWGPEGSRPYLQGHT